MSGKCSQDRFTCQHALTFLHSQRAISRNEYIRQTGQSCHTKRCANCQCLAGVVTAHQLTRGTGADLHQHDRVALVGLDGDFTAFIVAPRRHLVSRAQEQARDQEIVAHTPAYRCALKLGIAEARLDGDPHKAGQDIAILTAWCPDRKNHPVSRRQNMMFGICGKLAHRNTQDMTQPDHQTKSNPGQRQRQKRQQDGDNARCGQHRPSFRCHLGEFGLSCHGPSSKPVSCPLSIAEPRCAQVLRPAQQILSAETLES